MKKKVLILAVLIIMFGAVNVSGLAIGGSFALDFTDSAIPGGALSVRLDSMPVMWGLGFSLGDNSFKLGITGDWWLYHSPLFGIVSIYIGPGGYLNVQIGDNANILDIGARIPIGFQIFLIEPLELFLEIAPRIGLEIPLRFPSFGIQGAIGFRFWF